MSAHKTTDGLSTLFGNWFWLSNVGWDNEGDNLSAGVGNMNTTSSLTTTSSATAMVCPAITLKSTVKFSKNGTNIDPYIIFIP